MYLFHVTEPDYIYQILKDGALMPSEVTGNLSEGSGIYDHSPYVYFSTNKNISTDIKNIYGWIVLFFDSSLLYDREFYINPSHSGGITAKSKKYPINYHKIDEVLEELYNQSLERVKGIKYKAFQVFQQVMVKGNVSLKYLKSIYFDPQMNKHKDNRKVEEILNKYYPKVKRGVISIKYPKGGYKNKYKKYKKKYLNLKRILDKH